MFKEVFEKMESICVRSPGRINIIGEHVDYIETFSCSSAIDLHNDIIIIKTAGNSISFYSDRFGISPDIPYRSIYSKKAGIIDFQEFWYGYFISILKVLEEDEITIDCGLEVKIVSNLPDGAGLSSSASIELGFLYGLNELFNLKLSDLRMVQMAKLAENKYMYSPCGILDQYTIMFGRENNLLFLDYQSLQHRYIKIPGDLQFYIIDSKIKHSIAQTPGEKENGYIERIEQKNRLEQLLKQRYKLTLRAAVMSCINPDFTINFDKYNIDDATLTKRFRHFTSETARVLRFVSYLEKEQTEKAFALLYESFRSLSSDYEVSTPEIDKIVEEFSNVPQVLGCRMIGGGFGGSILIVSPESTGDFDLFNSYIDRLNLALGLSTTLYSLKTADGVHLI